MLFKTIQKQLNNQSCFNETITLDYNNSTKDFHVFNFWLSNSNLFQGTTSCYNLLLYLNWSIPGDYSLESVTVSYEFLAICENGEEIPIESFNRTNIVYSPVYFNLFIPQLKTNYKMIKMVVKIEEFRPEESAYMDITDDCHLESLPPGTSIGTSTELKNLVVYSEKFIKDLFIYSKENTNFSFVINNEQIMVSNSKIYQFPNSYNITQFYMIPSYNEGQIIDTDFLITYREPYEI